MPIDKRIFLKNEKSIKQLSARVYGIQNNRLVLRIKEFFYGFKDYGL